MKTEKTSPADFIVPLSINGLQGRVLSVPSSKRTRKREMLLIYGHHASLERIFSMAESLSEFGNVTVPDLPGFGGMDSFYRINQVPNVENMADYLATFIKLRYKKKRITILGMSWGFVVATKMLQKYPSLAKQVDLFVSMVGFTKYEEFKLSQNGFRFWRFVSSLFSSFLGSLFFRYILLMSPVIKTTYRLQATTHPKMKNASKEELEKRINFEVVLWHANDVRTHWFTGGEMLKLDLTHEKANLGVVHIEVDTDQYFDNRKVVPHLKQIFSDVTTAKAYLPNHAPTIIDDAKTAGAIFPSKVRKLLAKKPPKV